MICTISLLKGEYEPGEPAWGFLYPAIFDRSADKEKIDIFHTEPKCIEEGLMYKFWGER